MMTGQIGAVFVPMFGWQVMFLIGGIPGLVIALLLLRLPESPRWLIAVGCGSQHDRGRRLGDPGARVTGDRCAARVARRHHPGTLQGSGRGLRADPAGG